MSVHQAPRGTGKAGGVSSFREKTSFLWGKAGFQGDPIGVVMQMKGSRRILASALL